MLKLKLQYFGHRMQRAISLEKTLMLGKTEGRGEGGSRGWRDDRMASPTRWTWISANCGRQWSTEEPGVLKSMGSQKVRHDLVAEQWWQEEEEQTWVLNCPTSVSNRFIYSVQVDSWLLQVAKSNSCYLVISRDRTSFFLNTKRCRFIPYFKSMYS